MRGVVSDHGGMLEKFIGDAVMAVVGLTGAWGAAAERARALPIPGSLGGRLLRQ